MSPFAFASCQALLLASACFSQLVPDEEDDVPLDPLDLDAALAAVCAVALIALPKELRADEPPEDGELLELPDELPDPPDAGLELLDDELLDPLDLDLLDLDAAFDAVFTVALIALPIEPRRDIPPPPYLSVIRRAITAACSASRLILISCPPSPLIAPS